MASETTPPGDARAASGGRRRLDGAGAALGLYLLGLAAYLILAHKQALPVVSQDEYNYGRVARSIADGDGKTLMGGAYRSLGRHQTLQASVDWSYRCCAPRWMRTRV